MNIAVFCGASTPHNEDYKRYASELGRWIAEGGHTLFYGGSNLGMMGILSGAALEAGGRVVGVIPTFFGEEIMMSQPVSELVKVGSMAERKEYLIEHCDMFVALPGGIGTLDEVLEVMVANQLKGLRKPLYLLSPDGFFDDFVRQLERMGNEGLLRVENLGLKVGKLCDVRTVM